MVDSFFSALVGEGRIPLKRVLEHDFIQNIAKETVRGHSYSIGFGELMQKEASGTTLGAVFRLSRFRSEHIHVSEENGCWSFNLTKQLVLPWLIACGPTDMFKSPMGEQLENKLIKVFSIQPNTQRTVWALCSHLCKELAVEFHYPKWCVQFL